jgi:hypothetical protein
MDAQQQTIPLAGTGSGDAGWVCIHPVLHIRGRTYCPKAPKARLSGKFRLNGIVHAGNDIPVVEPAQESNTSLTITGNRGNVGLN